MGKAKPDARLKAPPNKPADDLERELLAAGQFGWAKALRFLSEPDPLVALAKAVAGIKSKPKPEEKLGPQERPVLAVLRDLWPPDGIPPTNVPKEIIKPVGDAFEKQHGRPVSRNTILRTVQRLKKHLRRRRQ